MTSSSGRRHGHPGVVSKRGSEAAEALAICAYETVNLLLCTELRVPVHEHEQNEERRRGESLRLRYIPFR